MTDVSVEVNSVICVFRFLTPQSRTWGLEHFNDSREVQVDLWHASNIVQAIQAEGMTTTPGALAEIERLRAYRLKGSRLSRFRFFTRLRRNDGPPCRDSSNRIASSHDGTPGEAEKKAIEVLGTILISLILVTKIWHVVEPLLTDVRRWWVS